MKYKDRWNSRAEIRSFEGLREYAAKRGEGISQIVSNFWRGFRAKTIEDRPLLSLVNPWGEVRRLRTFIDAMRHEELLAARNALDLYAENEVLRQYKMLADGEMWRFVPLDDHKKVKKELARTQEKLARASTALDEHHEEWMKSIAPYLEKKK